MTIAQRSVWLPFTALLTTAALHVPYAIAAETTPRDMQVLQEIIVTATRRTERLQDVPISVSAITTEDIQARGFTNYADFLNSIPGVYFQDAGPGHGTVRIRGISASEGGVPSTTATYFGETVTSVLTNFGGKPNLRLVDIERVEVLRGPQGTLFGASALAGVIRVIPNAPDLQEFDANVGVRGFTTAHSDDTSYHVEGTVNIPLVTDKLALRVVAYQDDIAGYIDNTFAGQPEIDWSSAFGAPEGTLVIPEIAPFTRRDINSEDTWGARAALTWQATDRLRFDLSHVTQDVTSDSESSTLPAAGDYETSRGLDVFDTGGDGERLGVNTLVANYDWDAVSLVSASSWTKMKRSTDQDITFLAEDPESGLGLPLPWALQDRSEGELFTQEVRLQSRGDQPFQWLVGAYYLDQEAKFSQFVPDYSCPACFFQVAAGQDFGLDAPLAKFSDEEQQSIFTEFSYRLSEQWTVGVGGRYIEGDLTSFDAAADGLLVGGPTTPRPPLTDSYDEINPSAYVRWEPTEAITTYAQASRGFRAGQVNQLLPDQCQAEAEALGLGLFTEPDTMWNYELGLKSQLADGRIGINTAVYRQKWEGVQLPVTLSCGFSNGFNAGSVTGDGVELELQAQPVDAWRFNLALSYNQSEFDRLVGASIYEVGERLPDVPEFNGSAGVQYNFAFGSNWTAFFRADYVYVGNVRLKFPTPTDEEPLASVVLRQDQYDKANVRLSFQRGPLSVDLFGDNIFDERGVVNTQQPSFGSRENLERPREVGVELRYSF
jgi:iron complex outermembrane receptor protein